MDIEILKNQRIQGYKITPKIKKYKGTIITFGGSEGSCLLNYGTEVAKEGFEVLSLYYFGKEGTPTELENIDISYAEEIFRFINETGMDSNTITFISASRGTEFSLLSSLYYKNDCNLILFAPSAFLFSSFTGNSTWLYKNKSLPYISFSRLTSIKRFLLRNKPLTYFFQEEINKEKNQHSAKIDISSLSGNILMFSGKQDQIWPSTLMANQLKSNSISCKSCIVYEFEDAGHTFSYQDYDGGTIDGNFYAMLKSQEIMKEKLRDWHSSI